MAYLLCDSGNGYPLLLIFNLLPPAVSQLLFLFLFTFYFINHAAFVFVLFNPANAFV